MKKPYKSLRTKKKPKTHKISLSMQKASKFKGCETVKGRECESQLITKQIKAFLKFNSNSILYLTGVPGSGKTHTTLSILNHLKLAYSYINCSTLKFKKEIYEAICECLKCFKDLPAGLQHLRFHLGVCKKPHILVIDEIDFLSTKAGSILYNLFELPLIEEANVFIIAISNTLGNLSPKLESRVARNRIEFKPYSAEQLMEVAMEEIQCSGAKADEKAVELITKRIAASTGDIRKVKDVIELIAGSTDPEGADAEMSGFDQNEMSGFDQNETSAQSDRDQPGDAAATGRTKRAAARRTTTTATKTATKTPTKTPTRTATKTLTRTATKTPTATPLEIVSAALKDAFTPLLNKFVASLNFYQKLALFLNRQPVKSIFQWFDEFKAFCKLREFPVLNFADFQVVVGELISFDIYKMKRDRIHVVCNYLKEEVEVALRGAGDSWLVK